MKKFKLVKNDAKSLQGSISMMDNPVLTGVALDVTKYAFMGGFAKAGPISFGKVVADKK